MQTVSSQFTARTEKDVQNLTSAALISFDKQFDPAIDFLEIGVSEIGGSDIIKGDSNVLQESDKYVYGDYSDRVLSIEYDRETVPPTNPYTMATATIILDNYDDIFTPTNPNSDLYPNVVPRRPIRIYVGYKGENIPVFIGLTEKKPELNERQKTATFRCIDFMSAIMGTPLLEEVMYVDMRTDEVIQALLESTGLIASQFDLDTGTQRIPFAYFKKDSKLGDAIKDICEFELGNLSMTETGRIKFENRTNWYSNTRVWDFDIEDSVIEPKNGTEDKIINVVEVTSNARSVQEKRVVYDRDTSDKVEAGETLEVFIDFKDDDGDLPVISANDPTLGFDSADSHYTANTMQDGSGSAYTDLDLISTSLFSTGMKLVFENTGSSTAYLTDLIIWGEPAPVTTRLFLRIQDDDSVGDRDGYEEKIHKVENNYIQDQTTAITLATILLQDRASEQDQKELLVVGVPQLQVGDVVGYIDENSDEDYFVTRINGIFNTSGFKQYLKLSKRIINIYFRIEISTIGGSDPLGP